MKHWFNLLAMCLPAASIAAIAAPDLPTLRLPPGSTTHGLPADLSLNRHALAIRVLDIALPLHEAADAMAGQFQPALHVLPDGGGLILLMSPSSPWLLRLSPNGSRTLGVLSAFASGRQSSPAAADAAIAWLPPGMQPRLSFQTRDDGVTATQQVFTHPWLAPSALAQRVFSNLARDGWTLAGAARVQASSWSRGHVRMALSVVALDQGSGLLALTTERETPSGMRRFGEGHD